MKAADLPTVIDANEIFISLVMLKAFASLNAIYLKPLGSDVINDELFR